MVLFQDMSLLSDSGDMQSLTPLVGTVQFDWSDRVHSLKDIFARWKSISYKQMDIASFLICMYWYIIDWSILFLISKHGK
jgi:hypothetical protein